MSDLAISVAGNTIFTVLYQAYNTVVLYQAYNTVGEPDYILPDPWTGNDRADSPHSQPGPIQNKYNHGIRPAPYKMLIIALLILQFPKTIQNKYNHGHGVLHSITTMFLKTQFQNLPISNIPDV